MKPLDVLFAISVAIVWGMGFVIAKAAMDHFPPVLLMALRFAVTSITLVWFFKPPISILKDLFWVALVSATIQYSLTFTGLKGIDASTAALLIQLEVPFGLLMGYMAFKDKITAVQFFGMTLTFIGTMFIVGEPSLSNSLSHIFLVIAGAFVWSVGQVMIKRLGDVGGFVMITWVAVLATPQLFIASFLLESNQVALIKSASIEIWFAVAYLGLVMTAIGYAIWYHLLGRYPVSRVMPFLLLLPVVAVAGGSVFLGETLTAKITIGGFLSLLGVAIITLRAAPKR